MSAGPVDARVPDHLWLPVVLLVAGVGLLVLGLASRVGGPVPPDGMTTPDDLVELGRLEAARSTAALVAGAGLVWVGSCGVAGASASSTVRRTGVLLAAIAALCLVQGLVVSAVVCAVGAAAAGVRLARGRARVPDGR